MAQGTLRRDSQLCVNPVSFLVEVLWKQIPEGKEKVQEREGEKHVQRPEVRNPTCGILQSVWLDAELRGRVGW